MFVTPISHKPKNADEITQRLRSAHATLLGKLENVQACKNRMRTIRWAYEKCTGDTCTPGAQSISSTPYAPAVPSGVVELADWIEYQLSIQAYCEHARQLVDSYNAQREEHDRIIESMRSEIIALALPESVKITCGDKFVGRQNDVVIINDNEMGGVTFWQTRRFATCD